MHDQSGLAIPSGGKFLSPRNGDRAVAIDNALNQPTVGLEAERERDDVEKERFIALPITNQNIGLPRGAHRHHLIRIKIAQGFQAKAASDCLTYRRRAG